MTEPGRARRRPFLAAVLVVLLLGGGLMARSGPVWARWSDDVPLNGAVFTSRTLVAPGSLACTAQGGLLSGWVDVSWTPVTAGVAHRVTLSAGTSSTTLLPDVPAGTNVRRITAAEVSSVLSVAGTVTVTVRAVAGTQWVSATAATRTISRTSVIGLGLDVRC